MKYILLVNKVNTRESYTVKWDCYEIW